jgi:hypothetical protein
MSEQELVSFVKTKQELMPFKTTQEGLTQLEKEDAENRLKEEEAAEAAEAAERKKKEINCPDCANLFGTSIITSINPLFDSTRDKNTISDLIKLCQIVNNGLIKINEAKPTGDSMQITEAKQTKYNFKENKKTTYYFLNVIKKVLTNEKFIQISNKDIIDRLDKLIRETNPTEPSLGGRTRHKQKKQKKNKKTQKKHKKKTRKQRRQRR